MKFSKYLFILPLFLVFSCTKVLHLAETKPVSYRIDQEANIKEDKAIEDLIQPYKIQLDAKMNLVIGELEEDLVKARPESTLGNWVADIVQKKSLDYYQKPIDFSIANYGGLRIPTLLKGNVTKGKIFELMPFDNMLVVLHLKGTTLLTFFDHMAAMGGWPISGEVQYLIEGDKAIDILLNGETIDPKQDYKIGMSDYIANGGDRCSFFKDQERDDLGKLFRDAIMEFVEEQTAAGQKLSAKMEGRVKLKN